MQLSNSERSILNDFQKRVKQSELSIRNLQYSVESLSKDCEQQQQQLKQQQQQQQQSSQDFDKSHLNNSVNNNSSPGKTLETQSLNILRQPNNNNTTIKLTQSLDNYPQASQLNAPKSRCIFTLNYEDSNLPNSLQNSHNIIEDSKKFLNNYKPISSGHSNQSSSPIKLQQSSNFAIKNFLEKKSINNSNDLLSKSCLPSQTLNCEEIINPSQEVFFYGSQRDNSPQKSNLQLSTLRQNPNQKSQQSNNDSQISLKYTSELQNTINILDANQRQQSLLKKQEQQTIIVNDFQTSNKKNYFQQLNNYSNNKNKRESSQSTCNSQRIEKENQENINIIQFNQNSRIKIKGVREYEKLQQNSIQFNKKIGAPLRLQTNMQSITQNTIEMQQHHKNQNFDTIQCNTRSTIEPKYNEVDYFENRNKCTATFCRNANSQCASKRIERDTTIESGDSSDIKNKTKQFLNKSMICNNQKSTEKKPNIKLKNFIQFFFIINQQSSNIFSVKKPLNQKFDEKQYQAAIDKIKKKTCNQNYLVYIMESHAVCCTHFRKDITGYFA